MEAGFDGHRETVVHVFLDYTLFFDFPLLLSRVANVKISYIDENSVHESIKFGVAHGSWDTRTEVCVGEARGSQYGHTGTARSP